MFNVRPRSSVRAVGGYAVAMVLLPLAATAQTQLPGIVVTTPSPIARTPTPQPAASPSAGTATPTPAPQPQQPAADSGPTFPLITPGLVVVDDAFAPVTIVSDRDLLARPAATLADGLQARPGIHASTFAPGASRPIIRGLDTYRVRIQENGIGSGDASTLSEDHAVAIDPYAARRVEVVRGPATLRYGSQAIGGVVAVENDRIPTVIPPRGVAVDMRGGLSSGDMGRDGAASVTAGSGSIALHADTFRRRSFDYDTPQGRQRNSFVDSEGVSLGGSVIGQDGYFGVAYTHIASLYGSPGAAALDERPRIDMAQDKVQAKGEWRVRDHGVEAIRLWLGSTRYAHNELVFEEAEDRDIIGTRFTNRESEARVEIQHLPVATLIGELRGAAGVQAMRKRTAGFGVEEPVDGLLDPAAHARTLAAFLFEELQLSRKLRLQGAARIESAHTTGTGIDDPLGAAALVERERQFKPMSASAGLLYDLPLGVVARLTAQYTERAPDLGELYWKGVHEATGTFEIGNPDLTLETATTIEFGLKRQHGDMRFDASVFRTRFDGFIFKNLTGTRCGDTLASCGVEDELDQLVFAQRDAVFTGLELAVELDVAPIWRGVWGVGGRYDLVHARFDDGVNVPRIPPQRLGGSLFYRDRNWLARIGALQAFRQDTLSLIDSKDTATSGYLLVDAELSYTWRTGGGALPIQEMTLGLRGDNLLDDDVRNHVSFKKDEVLQPGRTIRLFGSIKLE